VQPNNAKFSFQRYPTYHALNSNTLSGFFRYLEPCWGFFLNLVWHFAFKWHVVHDENLSVHLISLYKYILHRYIILPGIMLEYTVNIFEKSISKLRFPITCITKFTRRRHCTFRHPYVMICVHNLSCFYPTDLSNVVPETHKVKCVNVQRGNTRWYVVWTDMNSVILIWRRVDWQLTWIQSY
jgi:hypothetical protein